MRELLGVLLGIVERAGMEPPTLPSGAAFGALVEHIPGLLLAPLLASKASLNETLRGRDRDDVAVAQAIMDSIGRAATRLATAIELFRQVRPTKAGTLGLLLATENSQAAAFAKRVGLPEAMRLSNGERSAKDKETAILNAAQRLCALIYLTDGLPRLMDIVRPECTAMRTVRSAVDAKTALQELALGQFRLLPTYKLVGSQGPDHNLEFTSEARVGSHSAIGNSSSKRGSEQAAAAKLLAHFQRKLGVGPPPRVEDREDGYFKLAYHEIPAMHLRLLPALEQSLAYKFQEPRWLSIALTHASGRQEAPSLDFHGLELT